MTMPLWIDYDFGCGRTRRWFDTLEEFLADLREMRQQQQSILAFGYHCAPLPLGMDALTAAYHEGQAA